MVNWVGGWGWGTCWSAVKVKEDKEEEEVEEGIKVDSEAEVVTTLGTSGGEHSIRRGNKREDCAH